MHELITGSATRKTACCMACRMNPATGVAGDIRPFHRRRDGEMPVRGHEKIVSFLLIYFFFLFNGDSKVTEV
jgi:hypothetical protein